MGPLTAIGDETVICPNVHIGIECSIGAKSRVHFFASIGDGSNLGYGVYVGIGAKIGKDARIDTWFRVENYEIVADNAIVGFYK